MLERDDDNTPSLASGQQPAPAGGLPTGSLQEAWADELSALEHASSLDDVALMSSRIGGWLSALSAAQVISWPAHQALDFAREHTYEKARRRLLGIGQ